MMLKSSLVICLISSATVLSGVCFQDTEPLPKISRIVNQTQDSGRFNLTFGTTKEDRALDREISKAARGMRQAGSAGEKANAETELRELLAKDYDQRLSQYGEYLDELEKELDVMREKLNRGREAKAEMIDLRVKVLGAEADDLGWPSRVSKSRFPSWVSPLKKSNLLANRCM